MSRCPRCQQHVSPDADRDRDCATCPACGELSTGVEWGMGVTHDRADQLRADSAEAFEIALRAIRQEAATEFHVERMANNGFPW